jgi:hypothetical protein
VTAWKLHLLLPSRPRNQLLNRSKHQSFPKSRHPSEHLNHLPLSLNQHKHNLLFPFNPFTTTTTPNHPLSLHYPPLLNPNSPPMVDMAHHPHYPNINRTANNNSSSPLLNKLLRHNPLSLLRRNSSLITAITGTFTVVSVVSHNKLRLLNLFNINRLSNTKVTNSNSRLNSSNNNNSSSIVIRMMLMVGLGDMLGLALRVLNILKQTIMVLIG